MEETNTVVKSGNHAPRSRASPTTIPFPFWFVKTTNERHNEEEMASGYHIWKHCIDDTTNTTQPRDHLSTSLSKDENRVATIAACFLKDFEDGRHPTLSPAFDFISDRQLQIYRFKHSWPWNCFGMSLATTLLFAGTGPNQIWALLLQSLAILLFGIDLYMKRQLLLEKHTILGNQQLQQRHSSSRASSAERRLMYALATFLCILLLQNLVGFGFLVDATDSSSIHPSTLVLSMFKPIVFFYSSRRARDALEALLRIGKKLLRVILIELFLFLAFAAVACRLYSDDESFQTLARSWLSLFALSTTVVNPGIWMPAYNLSRWNAIFFVTFIVVGVFYLHSLVLSVVFQVFIHSATEVHRRSASDKEQSLRLSFLALTSRDKDIICLNSIPATENTFVSPRIIRATLRLLRPHYNRLKLKVLMDIVMPVASEILENEQFGACHLEETAYPLRYSQFRSRICQVLTSSVRVTRTQTPLGFAVEVLTASCSICNLIYVVLLTSKFDAAWFVNSEFVFGSLLTFVALLEALMRYNPIKFAYRVEPLSRLNAILDGTGTLGALISLFGIILKRAGNSNGMDVLLTGRAIGMIQSMRLSVWFREVLQWSLYVLPLLAGPMILVLSTVHVFVCVGMLLWSGAVDPDKLSVNENIEPLFYLNNFNSFGEGFITVFNVLVVNDWHQIANVFLYANRNSDAFIVYSFFVAIVIVAVCIMLNVVVAFFVETFVTHLKLVDVEDEVLAGKRNPLSFDASELYKTDIVSTNCSLTGETLQFDVIKREGYDEILEIAAKQNSQSESLARSLRDSMDCLTTMTLSSDLVGHLFCCRESMVQFSTKNYRRLVGEYLGRDKADCLVQEMVERLSNVPFAATGVVKFEFEHLVERYGHPIDSNQVLQVAGTILPHDRSIVVLTAEITSAYMKSA